MDCCQDCIVGLQGVARHVESKFEQIECLLHVSVVIAHGRLR